VAEPKKRGRPPKTKETGTAEWWLKRIDRAKEIKKDWRDRFRVDTAYDYWEGAQRPPEWEVEDWITVNLVYSGLLAELPTLYSQDPFYFIKLKRSFSPNPMDIAMYEARAKVRQAMLNYLKGELRLKEKSRMSIFDTFFQFGVCKVYRYADIIPNPKAGEQVLGDDDAPVYDSEAGEFLEEPGQIPANQAYKVRRIHPDDFLVDEDAGPLKEDVYWYAERFKENIENVKKDERYTKKFRDSVTATEVADETEGIREQRKKGGIASRKEKDPEGDTVVFYEMWDLRKKKWHVVAEGNDEFAIEPTDPPLGVDGDPYVTMRFNNRDDSWYPVPPMSQWIDPQKEYCLTRSQMVAHRKRFNRKYEANVPGLQDAEKGLSDLVNGEDGTVIECVEPGPNIYPIKDAPIDQNVFTESAILRNDFNDVAVGANQRGRGDADSATEAGILEKRAQIREGDRIGLVVDFVRDIGEKIDQLVQAYITQDEAVKVVGPQGEYWELVRTSDYADINGQYEYSVDVGSTTPQLPEIERAQWAAFLQLIANAPQLATSERLMTKMAEMHNINDEQMVKEIVQIAQQMMQMMAQQGGQDGAGTGSMPNVPTRNPSAMMGAGQGINNIRGGG